MSVSVADMVDAVGGGDTDETDARGQSRSRMPRMSASEFSSLKYNMRHQSRGVAVIINNINFHPKFEIQEPLGDNDEPSADVKAMSNLLETLGFKDIRIHKDLKASSMTGLLQEVATETNHTNCDCFVCVILTHGDDGYVLATDNKIPVDELVHPFKGHLCPSLAGKPKLFLIQSSRGFMPEADEETLECAGEEEAMDEETVRRIPTEADFLMAYSMIPAFRDISQRSWFIEAIHDVFSQNWETMDLLTMITRVNKKVAFLFESLASDEFEYHNKQIPYITSMLTKDVYFAK